MMARLLHRALTLLAAGALSLACVTRAEAQVVANGTFETGTLASWTRSGTSQSAAVQSSNFTGGVVNPPAGGGTFFAAISTGPGNRVVVAPDVEPQDYDADAGGTDDFDITRLSQTVNFDFGPNPAVLAFDWNFPSSEQDQPNEFDDIFDVRTTIGATTRQVFSRSACKNNGSTDSNFPNAPCTGLGQATWTINGAPPAGGPPPINGTQLRFGVGAWQHACVPIPNTVAGPNTVRIDFTALDQGDGDFDTALLLDNVEVRTACDATANEALRQVTISPNSATVENKGAGFEARFIASKAVSTNDTGTNLAFVSTANLTGDNPNVIPQVFTWDGAAYARVTGLAMTSDGEIQSTSLSGPTSAGILGRWIAMAADINAADNLEIYRWDRSTSTLSAVTATAGCDNINPTISADGTRVAYESTCAAETGAAAGVRRVVFRTFAAGVWGAPQRPMGVAGTCIGRNPKLNRNGVGAHLVLESDCDLVAGGNVAPNVNVEIYRRDIVAATWRQVTTTGATVLNASPSIDGSASGQFIFFVSSGEVDNATGGAQNADLSLEAFRFNTAAAAGSSTTQITNEAGGLLAISYIGTRSAPDGVNYAFERIDPLTGATALGRRNNTTFANAGAIAANERVVAIGNGFVGGVEIGVDATVPVVSFGASQDFVGTNADGNAEMFTARVQ